MTKFEELTQRVKRCGELDAVAGKPITAFDDLILARHTKSLRAAYEIGWQSAMAKLVSGRINEV